MKTYVKYIWNPSRNLLQFHVFIVIKYAEYLWVV